MKIFQFHLTGASNNPSTLVCRLVEGTLEYSLWSGHGSGGRSIALENIQFYDLVNNNIVWRNNRTLPVEIHQGETLSEFTNRVKAMLQNSTHKVVHVVRVYNQFKPKGETVSIPLHVYLTLQAASNNHREDLLSGIDEGIYELADNIDTLAEIEAATDYQLTLAPEQFDYDERVREHRKRLIRKFISNV